MRRFEKEDKSIKEIRDWVGETVKPHLLRTACQPKENLKTWYTKLWDQTAEVNACCACPSGTFSTYNYPLYNSAILDSGSTVNIFNNPSRFLNTEKALDGDSIWAGDKRLPIRPSQRPSQRLNQPLSQHLSQRPNLCRIKNNKTLSTNLQQIHQKKTARQATYAQQIPS
ncbi:hypothetical protein N0V88_000730 [Collariella sp. IMI 366227]|nr:hypothetical protein N0V88_000730 [Collariella sp. IMI 366227]